MPDRAPLRPDVRRPRDEREAELETLSPSPRLPERAVVDDPCLRRCRYEAHERRSDCEDACWAEQRKRKADDKEKESIMNTLSKRSRHTSDIAVNCRKCGDPLGYVVVYGHREWEHVECPSVEVRPTYPAIERAYAVYDGDPRVNGPEDFEAFTDAVRPILEEARRNA